MANLAFIVSGIEQSEESRIYQFRAATPAEVQAAEQLGLEVPGRFRFVQVVDPETGLIDPGDQFYIANGIAIDLYGCVTIPTDTITLIIDGDAELHGSLPLLVSKPGEDVTYLGTIQLNDIIQPDVEPVLATKVGDMVIFYGQ